MTLGGEYVEMCETFPDIGPSEFVLVLAAILNFHFLEYKMAYMYNTV